MPTLTIFAKDLAPWQPDIDSRRGEKASIVSGSNFVDDVDGPRSAFGSNFVNFNFWASSTRGKVTELKVADDILYGTQTGVYRINKTSGEAQPLLWVTVTASFWPWTIALVGGLYYIAQYDIGLWQYDPTNQTMKHVVTPAGDTIRYVAASFGRLIYLTPTAVAVSALDDGTNLTPDLATAAQAQAISIVGGTGLRIEPIPDGWLLYTTNGIMKATYTLQSYVFSYKNLTSAVKLTSPNAAVYIPRLGALSLDPSGFNLTKEATLADSGIPLPWELEMGDFIKKNILSLLNANLYGTICLYWSQAEQKLFVSFSDNSPEGVMNSGFVYTLVSQRWGSFDQQNTGIFETYSNINNVSTCSYMGIDGFMHAFNQSDYTQALPDFPLTLQDFTYRPTTTGLAEQGIFLMRDASSNTYELATTNINGSDAIPTAYNGFTVSGGYILNSEPYSDTANDDEDDPPTDVLANPILLGTYINMDVSGILEIVASGYDIPTMGLNSVLEVGPFRINDQVTATETSSVSELIVGISRAVNFAITEDWNVLFGDEDWNTGSGAEDWNVGNTPPNVFTLVLRTSDDGNNEPIQGDEDLYVFNNLGSSLLYYPIGYSGIYHGITLSALEANQAFALKFVELSALGTGRLLTATASGP